MTGTRLHQHYQLIQDLYVLIDDFDRQLLGEFDLNASQYRLLMQLDLEPGQRLTTLSDRLLLSKSTITRAVDQLEAIGWVERIADPDDRRAQRVVLTPAGVERRYEIAAAHKRLFDELFHVLTQDEQRQLKLLLGKLRSELVQENNHGEP